MVLPGPPSESESGSLSPLNVPMPPHVKFLAMGLEVFFPQIAQDLQPLGCNINQNLEKLHPSQLRGVMFSDVCCCEVCIRPLHMEQNHFVVR